MRLIGLMLMTFVVAHTSIGQPNKPLELHGLKPGMLTREIVLYSHAPLDTAQWGGSNGQSIISFKGVCLKDSGEFRVSVEGPEITQVLFVSSSRDTARTQLAYERMRTELEKLYGQPEKYHNVYRILTWESHGQELKLSTKDGGMFYSLTLTSRAPRAMTQDPHKG